MYNLITTLAFETGFGWDLVRKLFAWLDLVIYTVFGWCMDLMFKVVEVTGTGDFDNFLEGIHNRIYIILSLYMLFKVTISILTYIVNPDTLTDKSQGAGKLVMRIIISLVMLIAFPKVFDELATLQTDIIENGTIQRVLLGTKPVDPNNISMTTIADKMSLTMYNGVFIKENDQPVTSITNVNTVTFRELVEHVNDRVPGDPDNYKYEYVPVIGLAVGIFATLIMLSICIDIASRVFKLLILEMVAPIPIISYIDPKSSKDGAFSKWSKMLISTWAEIFIKLFIVYFILKLAQDLTDGNLFPHTDPKVTLVLIIGLLFFAKELPKFICDSLGIKEPGNLFKDIGKVLATGALFGGAVGSTVGMAMSSFRADTDAGRSHNPLRLMKNMGAGLFGGLGGLATGGYALATSKDQNSKAVMDARNKFLANQRSGNTLSSRLMGGAKSMLTGYDIDYEIKRAGAIEESASRLRSYTNSEGAKYYSDDAHTYTYTDAAGVQRSITMSRNDLKLGIANSSNNGGQVIVNGVSLGAADGSIVSKLTGDADEFVGDSLMDGVDNGSFFTRFGKTEDDVIPLTNNRKAYQNVTGMSSGEVARQRNKQLKVAEKSNKNRKENLNLQKNS